MKKTIAFLFFMLAAIVLGAFLAYLGAGTRYFDWLAWGKTFGINNFGVDFYVINFGLTLNIRFTVSQLITIPVGLIVYSKTGSSL